MAIPNPYEYADLLEPELRKLYLRMVAESRGRVPLAELQRALQAKDVSAVSRIIERATGATNPETVSAWKTAIEEIFGKTATLGTRVGNLFGFSFNMFNPMVLGEIDNLVARQMAADIGADARQGIRNIVTQGWVDGITVPNQAQMIRGMIGPTIDHNIAADNYLQQMIDSGVPDTRAVHNAELYRNRLLNWRADAVARTENIRAANAGRLSAWRQMIADGFIEQHRVVLKWFVEDDDRLCPYCAPMDGQEIRWGGTFLSDVKGFPGEPERRPKRYPSKKPDPYGQQRDELGRFAIAKAVVPRPGGPVRVEAPPLHPMCRCDVRLILV